MNNNQTSTHPSLCNITNLNSLGDFKEVEHCCQQLDPENLWCGRYDVKRILSLVYLLVLIIVGVFGNLLVILSVANSKKLYKNGNVFIVNLAIVDLLVSYLYLFLVSHFIFLFEVFVLVDYRNVFKLLSFKLQI